MALPEAGHQKQLEQSAGSGGDLSFVHVCAAQEKNGDIAPGALQLPWVPPASSTLRRVATATELSPASVALWEPRRVLEKPRGRPDLSGQQLTVPRGSLFPKVVPKWKESARIISAGVMTCATRARAVFAIEIKASSITSTRIFKQQGLKQSANPFCPRKNLCSCLPVS